MARIRVHTREDVPAEAREAVAQIAGSVGRLSRMLGELAHMGNLFNSYFNRYARTEFDVPAAPALPE
ncbi:hypothetical protein [Sinomonas atrocyanea]|uniref:hypothetical protein n=1 Tax=Sinomonas atrocyanea TaxID=37927 RepID=UPI003D998EAA